MSDEPARYLRLISEIKLELNKIMTLEDKIQIVLKQNIPEFVITSTVGKVLRQLPPPKGRSPDARDETLAEMIRASKQAQLT